MPIHPLEPLSSSEIQDAVNLLRKDSSFTPTTRIISVMLKEPAKSCVYAWKDGSTQRKRAAFSPRSPTRSRTRTSTASFTATSSPRTFSSTATAHM